MAFVGLASVDDTLELRRMTAERLTAERRASIDDHLERFPRLPAIPPWQPDWRRDALHDLRNELVAAEAERDGLRSDNAAMEAERRQARQSWDNVEGLMAELDRAAVRQRDAKAAAVAASETVILVPIPDFIRNDPRCFYHFDPTHPEYGIDADGRECFAIDAGVAEPLRVLWDAGIKTMGCCDGHGSGTGVISFPTHEDALPHDGLNDGDPYRPRVHSAERRRIAELEAEVARQAEQLKATHAALGRAQTWVMIEAEAEITVLRSEVARQVEQLRIAREALEWVADDLPYRSDLGLRKRAYDAISAMDAA